MFEALFLYLKFQASVAPSRLDRLVCAQPDWKLQRQIFSGRCSYNPEIDVKSLLLQLVSRCLDIIFRQKHQPNGKKVTGKFQEHRHVREDLVHDSLNLVEHKQSLSSLL